jgi:arginyl-tRNA synthetase
MSISVRPMQFSSAIILKDIVGMVLGMSTRKGTAVFLDDVIREAAAVMKEKMMSNEEKYNAIEDPEAVAQEIGMSAIKIQDMAAKRCAS